MLDFRDRSLRIISTVIVTTRLLTCEYPLQPHLQQDSRTFSRKILQSMCPHSFLSGGNGFHYIADGPLMII